MGKKRTKKRHTTDKDGTVSGASEPSYVIGGTTTDTIDVNLSYRIIELFSEGLYTSANKAFEELVANSFDAGARKVHVLLPNDPSAEDATIVVVDNGEAMDADGLKRLWNIGASNKRDLGTLPQNRKQIGKFGIGKLATYVLANQLTYICKSGGKYYATTMDYSTIKDGTKGGLSPARPMQLDLRVLTANQAKSALERWITSPSFKKWNVPLFGRGAPSNWVVAILSSLKDKANEIVPGKLRWILSTALPLRDDFSIFLDGDTIEPSKRAKGRIGRWMLGKEIKKLSGPAPDNISVRPNQNLDTTEEGHYGLFHPDVGRITGYVEAYKDVLTGSKSTAIGRSYGFFVYVRGRLVNIDDEYFGIDSNLLRHGTFARCRVVVHIDKLDEELRSNRETIQDGPLCTTARNVLHALFNWVRPKLQEHDESESPGARLSRKLAGSPASLSRRPIIELARSTLAGEAQPRYTIVPDALPESEHEAFLESLTERAEAPDKFVENVELSFDIPDDGGIAAYDTQTAVLKINALHPFVGAFSDDFQNRQRSFPLELLAMAEVLWLQPPDRVRWRSLG